MIDRRSFLKITVLSVTIAPVLSLPLAPVGRRRRQRMTLTQPAHVSLMCIDGTLIDRTVLLFKNPFIADGRFNHAEDAYFSDTPDKGHRVNLLLVEIPPFPSVHVPITEITLNGGDVTIVGLTVAVEKARFRTNRHG